MTFQRIWSKTPNEDTEPRVQQLFVGSYRETGMWSQDLAGAGFCVSTLRTSLLSASFFNNNFMDKDPTKKCSECFAEVPAQAKKCSHCGSKLPQPTSRIVKILIALCGIGIFTSIVINGIGGSSTPSTTKKPNYEGGAIIYAEPYVSRLLKSPSTADFCSGTATDLGNNKWKVSSCVDSQNSYGAMIRSNWEVVMVYTGGDPDNIASWEAEKVTFDGKVVYQK